MEDFAPLCAQPASITSRTVTKQAWTVVALALHALLALTVSRTEMKQVGLNLLASKSTSCHRGWPTMFVRRGLRWTLRALRVLQ